MFKALWHKFLGGKDKPWADIQFENKKLVVKNFNNAFVEQLKTELGDLTDDKTDAEIVQLFGDRENIEHEEPRLEVLHFGVDEDGRVKMSLDWNTAFIKHLKAHGINAPTEEEAVEIYLMLLQRQVDESFGVGNEDVVSKARIDDAFAEVDSELARETAEALAQARKDAGKKKRRGGTHRTIDPDTNLPITPQSF